MRLVVCKGVLVGDERTEPCEVTAVESFLRELLLLPEDVIVVETAQLTLYYLTGRVIKGFSLDFRQGMHL
jgi:hypothetical protein